MTAGSAVGGRGGAAGKRGGAWTRSRDRGRSAFSSRPAVCSWDREFFLYGSSWWCSPQGDVAGIACEYERVEIPPWSITAHNTWTDSVGEPHARTLRRVTFHRPPPCPLRVHPTVCGGWQCIRRRARNNNDWVRLSVVNVSPANGLVAKN